MAGLKDFQFLRLVPLAAFFLAVPTLAQFEVAPDHFDSSAKNASVRKSAPKNKAALARPASTAVGHATAGAVAKAHEKSTRGSDARSTAGPVSGGTSTASPSTVDRTRMESSKRKTGSSIAKATPAMSQRE